VKLVDPAVKRRVTSIILLGTGLLAHLRCLRFLGVRLGAVGADRRLLERFGGATACHMDIA